MDYRKSHKITLASLLVGFAIGVIAWLPFEPSIVVVLLLPLLIRPAATKLQCALLIAGYYMGCTYGMVRGIAQFPGGSWELGIAFLISTSALLSLPYLIARRYTWLGWPIACLILFFPPYGFLNWTSPLMVSAYLFPGLGFIGVMLTVLCFTLIRWQPKTAILFVLISCITHLLINQQKQEQYLGVNTSFPTLQPNQINFATDQAKIETVLDLAKQHSMPIQVFPESTIRNWTSFTGNFIQSQLRSSKKTLLIGVQYPEYENGDITNWVNGIAMINSESHEIVYKQETPIPYFMWKPGDKSGNTYQRNLVNSVRNINGQKIKMFICYEAFTLRSLFSGTYFLSEKPDLLITIGNYGWATGTNIEAVYQKLAKLAGRQFMRPVVVSSNR